MDTTKLTTNIAIGRMIGLTHAQVSRLRSGTRETTADRMITIARVFDWDINDQAAARVKGTYHLEFEKAIERWAKTQVEVSEKPDPETDQGQAS